MSEIARPEDAGEGARRSSAGPQPAEPSGREPPGQAAQLANLRDSGTIEQDADVVMFIYRDEYYLEQSAKKGAPEHIASMGLGPTGVVPMRFNDAYTKFPDMGAPNG
jgi:replicative DNA helicase